MFNWLSTFGSFATSLANTIIGSINNEKKHLLCRQINSTLFKIITNFPCLGWVLDMFNSRLEKICLAYQPKLCLKDTRIKHVSKILPPVTVTGKHFSASRETNIASMLAFRSFICTDGRTVVEGFDFGTLWNNGGAPYISFVSKVSLTPGNRLLFWDSSNFEMRPFHWTW